jgi:hypothetical protein
MADQGVIFVQAAVHEAGHAVIAAKLGIKVRSLKVGPGYVGQVETDGRPGSREYALMALAGPIAERKSFDALAKYAREAFIYGHRRTPGGSGAPLPVVVDVDKVAVQRYLKDNLFEWDGGRELAALKHEVRELVNQHWKEIRAVIDALSDRVGGDFEARLSQTEFEKAIGDLK